MATLGEIKTSWNIIDVLNANELLDIIQAKERKQIDKSRVK